MSDVDEMRVDMVRTDPVGDLDSYLLRVRQLIKGYRRQYPRAVGVYVAVARDNPLVRAGITAVDQAPVKVRDGVVLRTTLSFAGRGVQDDDVPLVSDVVVISDRGDR